MDSSGHLHSENSGGPGQIQLGKMQQQEEVRTQEDDWTGIMDATERRKLQNRLNQRSYRKRRAAKPKSSQGKHQSYLAERISNESLKEQVPIYNYEVEVLPSLPVAQMHTSQFLDFAVNDHRHLSFTKQSSIHNLSSTQLSHLMKQYELLSQQNFLLGSPRIDQLLTLVQFNVLRAIISNTFAMGFGTAWVDDEDAISPFLSTSNANFQPRSYTTGSPMPPSLLPTQLQCTVPHHPWIDLFPFPEMRDNLLLAEMGDGYDEWALCNDLVDFCDVTNDKTGLIVWKEPWDPRGWEVSESFLQRWGWVVKGCKGLLISTNSWREKRGEEALVWEV